jgi:hypothetical protein
MGMSIVAECRAKFPAEMARKMGLSFMLRWDARGTAGQDGLLEEFSRKTDDGTDEIHGAVFMAAAECPLAEDGGFDETFVERIRKIMAE